MPVPRIAIVGRPNVGKSSLLNLLAADKVSIVDPTAGTTRDRVSILVDLVAPDHPRDSPLRRTVEITDTGGFGVYVADGRRFNDIGADLRTLTKDIEFQISQAVGSADIVLFVIDAQAGVTPQDEEIARLLRERVLGKKENPHLRVIVVANKTDGPRWESHALEAAAMGFGVPIPVSAKNNYFRRDFLDALYNAVVALPRDILDDGSAAAAARPELKIAIIGKRNAGKSSLVNALAGEQRVIVSEIAGTTRDAVDVRFEFEDDEGAKHSFIAIDTAGLRKKKSFADRIEWWAFDRAKRSIERSDVVLLLIDSTEPVSQVDQQLAMLVQKSFKPVVLAVNKWDLAEGQPAKGGKAEEMGRPVDTEMYETYLRREFKGLDFAPIAFLSAVSGKNIHATIALAAELHKQSSERAGTGMLNRLLKHILDTRGPTTKLGTFAKAYFIAQVAVNPPTIVLVVNKVQMFTPNYQRFLINRLREQLPFPEVPIRLVIKERKRARVEDLLSGEHQRMREESRAKKAGVAGVRAGAMVHDDDEGDFDIESLGDDAAEYFKVDPIEPLDLEGINPGDAEIEDASEIEEPG